MSDTHIEFSQQGWLSRIKDSFKGILAGILLVLIAAPLLFWNEGRAVKRAKDLSTGKGAVVSVDADKVIASNEGALVHLSGEATPGESLRDEEFGISTMDLKLNRVVEMYQWVEEKSEKKTKKVGGKEETKTTYDYKKEWSPKSQLSSGFKVSEGHKNPGEIPYAEKAYTAEASVGAFALAKSAVDKIPGKTTLDFDKSFEKALAKELREEYPGVTVSNNRIYLNGGAKTPKVGDVRISYTSVKPQVITVVAAQKGKSLLPYTSKKLNNSLELVSAGEKSAEEMFEQAASANATMTWILRLLGFLMNFIGLALILGPFSVIADVLPLAGDIVAAGTKVVAGIGGIALSALVISVGWIFYRPLLGVPLLLLAIGCIVMVVMKIRLARAKRSVSAPIA